MFSTSTARRHTFIRRACATALPLFYVVASVSAAQKAKTCDVASAVQQANGLLKQSQYQAVARALDRLHRCRGLSALEQFQIGWLYGRANRFDTALKIFNSVPENVPNRLTHGYAVALSTFELGNYKGAVAVLTNLQAAGRFDGKCANLLAVSYSKLGLYKDAYPVLAAEIEKNPNDLKAYLNLITVCAAGGDLPKAAQIALRATHVFPHSAETFIVLGAANIQLGHLHQAYGDFQAAVRLSPHSGEARFFLALTDYKQDKFSGALAILHSAVKQGVENSDLHYLMAECLLKAAPDDSSAIIAELNRAIKLNKNSVPARTLRGRLFLQAGHPKQAITDLETAIRDDPDSTSAVYNLARAYRAVGKSQEAKALFKKVRKSNSTSIDELSERRLTEALEQRGSRQ
ncbi:MAG TPA: tetratricopeptide repeat protein [Bryobacteraceae bacterium]